VTIFSSSDTDFNNKMKPNLSVDTVSSHKSVTKEDCKSHSVVAMPPRESLGSLGVQDFRRSHESKTPTFRRPATTRRKGRVPVSRSRDIVQEVYDRMGVNLIRGQDSIEFYDNNNSKISINSETKTVDQSRDRGSFYTSNATHCYSPMTIGDDRSFSTAPERRIKRHSFSVDKRNDQDGSCRGIVLEEERDGQYSPVSVKSRISIFGGSKSVASRRNSFAHLSSLGIAQEEERDGRSAKSRISVFGGDKSVASRNSFAHMESPSSRKTSWKSPPKYIHAVSKDENQIDYRNDVDANMSVVSLDESQCVNGKVIGKIQTSTKPKVANSQGVKKNVPVEILQPEQNKDCKGISATASADSEEDPATASKIENTHGGDRQSTDNASGHATNRSSNKESTSMGYNGLTNEIIDKIIEEKLQVKLTALTKSFESQLSRLKADTMTKLDEMEVKLKSASMPASESQPLEVGSNSQTDRIHLSYFRRTNPW
jgi:hypothetical protein